MTRSPCHLTDEERRERRRAKQREYSRRYREKHPERIKEIVARGNAKTGKERSKRYYERHSEKRRAARREYYWKNKDKQSAYMRAWGAKNKDKKRANFLRWAANNPGRPSELFRKWVEANRDRYNGIKSRRRKYVRQATPPWVDMNKIIKIYAEKPPGHQVDHIMPIMGKNLRGLHVPWNLQYLPVAENQKKGNRVCQD